MSSKEKFWWYPLVLVLKHFSHVLQMVPISRKAHLRSYLYLPLRTNQLSASGSCLMHHWQAESMSLCINAWLKKSDKSKLPGSWRLACTTMAFFPDFSDSFQCSCQSTPLQLWRTLKERSTSRHRVEERFHLHQGCTVGPGVKWDVQVVHTILCLDIYFGQLKTGRLAAEAFQPNQHDRYSQLGTWTKGIRNKQLNSKEEGNSKPREDG